MIKLGEIKFDSGDSGPGTLELLSEGDYMWIRIHKFGPEEESLFVLKKSVIQSSGRRLNSVIVT